ncbi:hypothetical protein [Streptomyces iranensis]|uniref:Uncharacterized protein n=1 Tax=Streptomyces iranensis TaxID=576784 RepID=A0ABS4N1E5_9ACTN|nr:hypothetical protein [Streptomyces iranensis]MBP2065829.1 hypothetical protein [Streptomyces iranensis]
MEHWCLIRMVSKELGSNGHHSLKYIRDLRDGEKGEIDDAQKLLRSFSGNWQGNAVDLSFQRFNEVFEECVMGIQKANGCLSDSDRSMLSRAAVEAAEAISSWPRKVLGREYDNLGDTPETQEAISDVAKKLLSEGSPILALERIGECRDDSLVSIATVSREGRNHLVAHFRKEVLHAAGVPGADNWVVQEFLAVGLSQLQYLAATILKTHRKQIEKSAQVILSLHGETLYGHPTLVPKDVLANLGKGRDLSFTPVEKPNLEGILRAVDTAEGLLEREDDRKVQPGSPATSKVVPVEPEKMQEGEAKDPPGASDLATLLTYVSNLSTDLEKRWSSLVEDEGSEPQKEVLNKWYSFISSLKFHVGKQDRSTGPENRPIVRFPMAASDFTPDPAVTPIRRSLNQAAIAEMYAVRNLVDVMQGLRQPTASQIDLITGSETHWWESGAFNLVRKAAEVALRIVNRRDQLIELGESQDSNNPELVGTSRAADIVLYLSLSRAAMDQGLPESSLLYCSMTLRGIAIKFGGRQDSAEQVASTISAGSRSALREPTEQVMVLVRDLASGRDAPLEQIFNLASFWYEAIGPLVEEALAHTTAAHDESATQ